MLVATLAVLNVGAQEPAPSELPPPANPELFFSGPVIDGPGFCWYRSLGGQRTYAFDRDDDGVAETCSLPRSRREAVARQLAMERLARRQFGRFAELFDEECQNVAESYGDPVSEATDDCSHYRAGENRPTGLLPLVPSLSTNPETFFNSPVVNSRYYCTNFTFGFTRLYANDSDSDGIADVCSLYNTKRASVARQFALERLREEQSGLYGQYLDEECRAIPATFGEPEAEADDACGDPRKPKPQPTIVSSYVPPVVLPPNRVPSGPPVIHGDPTKCGESQATFDTTKAPENFEVSGRTGGSLSAANAKLTLQWDPVPGAKCYDVWYAAELRDSSKLVQGRKYWKLGAHVYIQAVYFPPADHPSDQKLTLNFRNVVAGTWYDAKVRAASGTRGTPWTETLTGKTSNSVGKTAFERIKIVSSTAIEVDWTYAAGAYTYELQYRKKVGGTWTTDAIACPTREDYVQQYYDSVWEESTDAEKDQFRTQFDELYGSNFDGPTSLAAVNGKRTLTGLDPNTAYEFQVRGVANGDTCSDATDDLYGAWSNTAEAVTVPSNWATTVTASLDANDAPQLSVTWPAVTDADSYKVRYQDPYFRESNLTVTIENVTTNSVTIDSLECGTQYWVRVLALIGDLQTPLSDEDDATTETAANGCDDN